MKAFKLISLVLILFFAAVSLSAGLAHPATEIGDYPQPAPVDAVFERPTDQIILQYRDTATVLLAGPDQANEMARLSAAAGVDLAYGMSLWDNTHTLKLPQALPEADIKTITERLMALPEVAYAEPDAILFYTLTPNDSNYGVQWHFSAPGGTSYGINAPAAWDIVTGTANIVVAILDTGITNHQDLAGRTVPGYDFITDVPTANDGNARDTDPSDPGDWVTLAESTTPGGPFAGCAVLNSSWHGTHVAGTIGAASNNSLGVAGVNWNSKILPVRVLGKCGGYSTDIVAGMRWAAGLHVENVPDNTHPAKVLNMSLSGPGACLVTYQQAIDAIRAAGTSVVVSAGNNQADPSGNPGYRPANCNGVITVAATNRNGSRAWYSNYGSTVEISAPGGETTYPYNGVLSTINSGTQGPIYPTTSGDYTYYQGTSQAAPHVAGVASLLYSLSPSLTPTQIQQILQNTVTFFPVGSTCTTLICGSGIVNAGQAVAFMPRLSQVSPAYIEPGTGPITLTVSGANFNASSVIHWGNQVLATSVVSTTQLTATLMIADVNRVGNFAVTVAGAYPPYGTITTVAQNVQVGEILPVYLPAMWKNFGWNDVVVEGFEGTFPSSSWALSDLSITGYTWGKTTCRAYAGSHSAWVLAGGANGTTVCGTNYLNNMKSGMTYGPFSLSNALAANVQLRLWLYTENVLDRVCVGASEDGLNFYGDCYSGQSNAWLPVTLNLGSANGHNFIGKSQVWVRIYFESDFSSVRPEGAFVDDFIIRRCMGGNCGTQPASEALLYLEVTPWEKQFQP